jgi:cell division septal protein FtsQ
VQTLVDCNFGKLKSLDICTVDHNIAHNRLMKFPDVAQATLKREYPNADIQA